MLPGCELEMQRSNHPVHSLFIYFIILASSPPLVSANLLKDTELDLQGIKSQIHPSSLPPAGTRVSGDRDRVSPGAFVLGGRGSVLTWVSLCLMSLEWRPWLGMLETKTLIWMPRLGEWGAAICMMSVDLFHTHSGLHTYQLYDLGQVPLPF